MPEGDRQQDPKQQAEEARKAFEQDFGRFVGLRPAEDTKTDAAGSAVDESARPRLAAGEILFSNLSEAETALRELGELRSRHTGKKSALASVKKMIGRVEPSERASFGQLV